MRKSYLTIIALAGLILASCGNKNQQAAMPMNMPVPVTTDTVEVRTDVTYNDEYPATVVALNQVELRPQVSGFITGIHFADGARVRKGQLLYSIDQQLYEANYQQAVANLRVQEATMDRAQKDADRYHALDKKDAVAKQLVDNADAALAVAKRQVEASKAAIQGVATNVRYTKVIAPFDGVIGISQVRMGAAVTAGQTLLNTVSTSNPVAVDVNIDQSLIYKFSSMIAANKVDSSITMAFGNDVYPYHGKAVLLDRAVDVQTGTIKLRLSFPNNDGVLKPGMNANVRILGNKGQESVAIPYKAVVEQLGEYFVYKLGDSSKVTQQHVVLGKQISGQVIVKEGLKHNDIIVIDGIQNLKEGSVVLTPEQQAKAAAQQPAAGK